MYYAYITRLKDVRKHPNADRLQLGTCFGNTVVVSLDYTDNQLGIYFPSDGQLSVEFAEANNLLRKKDENGNNIGGYMDPDKRNVTAIKLRGEKSDGLFLPLTCLETFGDISTLAEGDRIDNFNGVEICKKYIPRKQNKTGGYSSGNKTRKTAVPIAPLFREHADTEQLAYNHGAFSEGDYVEITLKMHGTSQRTAYLPRLTGYKKSFWDILFRREGKPTYEWDYVCGTRRVVLDNFDGGFYGSNAFREDHFNSIVNKLWKGETIYYEVVGFTSDQNPIMGRCDNTKTNDKEFINQYGSTTTFSYGCEPSGYRREYVNGTSEQIRTKVPVSDMYAYRMTITNEDGDVVEYPPDFVRYRCDQMGIKTVPVLWRGIIPNLPIDTEEGRSINTPGEFIQYIAEQYYDGPDPIGKTHIREGVVARIVNRPKFCAYKHKNWYFKCLEGIVKAEADAPDMEEAQDETVETE